ncbi:MAG: hypothetical protein AAFV29_14920, partial [Myxococcota bacterium]
QAASLTCQGPRPVRRARLAKNPWVMRSMSAGRSRSGRGPWHVSDAAWGAMQSYRWPGNVRELINALERATILSNSGQLDDIVPASNDASAMPNRKHATDGPWSTLVDVETDHIRRTPDHTKGRLYGNGGAAELLGMKPTTLQSRMRKLGIARVDDT